ncbi:MAG: NAD(P)H-hydrate dehydratase [Phycisphaerae bacterium]|jgi:NAD(P)H-hydrate epimerase|nr:NAD(P)H-hydrate dehydratase [Phycisphaerae bacterium]
MSDIQRITDVGGLEPRDRESHKSDFGRVLIVGGSRGMIGAPALSGNAAFRGGAGLVTLAVPEPVQLTVASLCCCATSIPLNCDENGDLSARAAQQIAQAAEGCDVLAVGPGMGVGVVQENVIRFALDQSRPVVLDADGLNNLAAISNWPQLRNCPLVLTPHPGEFARLTGLDVSTVQAGRESAAVEAVGKWGGSNCPPPVCLLKGSGTVVTDATRLYVNDTGNPGMAAGGSGDVLTGLIAAFIGGGLSPFDAACLAARIHGLAGDLAADELGETSMTAADIIDYLPAAIRKAG